MTYPNKPLYPFMEYLTHEDIIQAGCELLDWKQKGELPPPYSVFSRISELISKDYNDVSLLSGSLFDLTQEAIEHEVIRRFLNYTMELKEARKEKIKNGSDTDN